MDELFDLAVPGNMVAVHFKPNAFIDVLTRKRSRVDDAPISRLGCPPYGEPHDIEWPLVPERELPLASHV